MKIRPLIAVLLLCLLVIYPHQKVLGENQLTEDQALTVLITQIKKDKLYDSWTTMSCLQFFTEEKTKQYFDFAIHEKHDGKCPGDPDTWPIVDRFRVDRSTRKIQWFEPAEGELHPYKDVLKVRLKR